jgi:ATP-dependent helicase/DNAse subunit B
LTPRLERARESLSRTTALTDKKRLRQLKAMDRFNVTALDRFGDCSSWWFVERMLTPPTIDAAVDPLLAGSVAHTVLHRFYRAVPATFGKDRLEPADAERAESVVAGLVRDALRAHPGPTDSVAGRVLERRLVRDLGAFVRREAEQPAPLAATRFEVSFGGGGAAAGLKEGLRIGDFAVVGKIDRIDTDPGFSARGLIHDYKSGTTASSAAAIRRDERLQLPLYLLAVRELLGIEPVGGLFRALGLGGATRGLVDASQDDALPPGLYSTDVLQHDEFEAAIAEARATAVRRVGRIRRGDVRHDPRGGQCPPWCPWAGVCRVQR